MDDFEVTRRYSKFIEKTYFRGGEQEVCDKYEWRDYHKDVEGGRFQVWKNARYNGNYNPATIEEMLEKMKRAASQCYQ
jgi:hypothetical protein